jgi:hypothetical protein
VPHGPAEAEQHGDQGPVGGEHALLVAGVGGGLVGEQEAGPGHRRGGPAVEQPSHVGGIGHAPGCQDRNRLAGDLENTCEGSRERFDPDQVAAGFPALDHQPVRSGRERRSGLLGRADGDEDGNAGSLQRREPSAGETAVEHHERGASVDAGLDVSPSGEGNKQVGGHGSAWCSAACLVQRVGERPRRHDPDRAEGTGRRDRTRELATRDAAAHARLHHRMLQADPVAEVHVVHRRHPSWVRSLAAANGWAE